MTTEVRNPSEAPGELDLVRRFVNTLDIEEGTDDLSTPAEARAWLEGEGWRTRVGERELRELVSFREAVRDLVGSRGTESDEDAVAAIDKIAPRHRRQLRLVGGVVPALERGAGIHRAGPGSRGGRGDRWVLGPHEDLCEPRVPLALLRPLEESLPNLVHDGPLRQSGEDARVSQPPGRPREPVGRTARALDLLRVDLVHRSSGLTMW
jgi:hypothetical protein